MEGTKDLIANPMSESSDLGLLGCIENRWRDENQKDELSQKIDRAEGKTIFDELVKLADKGINDIPQDIVDRLVKRTLEYIEEMSIEECEWDPTYVDTNLTIHLSQALFASTEKKSGGEMESLLDKVFRALPQNSLEYSRASDSLLNIIAQQHLVPPQVFIETLAESLFYSEAADPYFSASILHSFQYLRRSDLRYEEAFAKSLDFSSRDSFGKTSHTLDLIQRLHNLDSDRSFTYTEGNPVLSKLKEEAERKEGSFLLYLRAKILFDNLQNKEFIPQDDSIPFLITKERYSFKDSTHHYSISSPRDFKKITDLLEEAKKAKRNRDVRGESEIIEHAYMFMQDESLWQEVGISNGNENEDEYLNMSSDQRDYLWMISKPIRGILEKEFNIHISDLSLDEQFYFLNFVKEKNVDDIESVKSFTVKYGANGFRTFLSLEHGGKNFGDKIIEMSERLSDEGVNNIFAKYTELIFQLENVGNVLKEAYGNNGHGEEIEIIKSSILKKGNDLLSHFADMVQQGKEVSTEEVLGHLEHIEAEATTFFLTFQTLKAAGQLPPMEEIKGLSFEEKKSNELAEEDIETIRSLYRTNYKDNPQLIEKLLQSFNGRVENPETRFYILKYGGKLRASIGFTADERIAGNLQAHSFNVEAPLQGISIGTTMMEIAMDREAASHILEADCAAYEKIGAKYIESGYVADDFYEYEGSPSLHITRDDIKNSQYWGKNLIGKESEILSAVNNAQLPEDVGVLSAEKQSDIDMSIMKKGFVMTRYFFNKDSKKWFAVFERVVNN